MKPILTAAALLLAACASAGAMDISRNGTSVELSGRIKNGDQFAFRDFINLPENAAVRFVYLNSGGGFVLAATEIARAIRVHKLATVIDAATSTCSSACTAIFGGGVQRHYINAARLQDGVFGFAGTGLGFHEGSSADSRDANRYNGAATAQMVGSYYEMGIANARYLAAKAPPNKLYRLSGSTALALGIATSLARP